MSLEFTYSPIVQDSDLRAEIVVRVDGEPVARSKVNLSSDRSRRAFCKAVVEAVPRTKSDDVARELLRIADEIQRERNERAAREAEQKGELPRAVEVPPISLSDAKTVVRKWLAMDDETLVDIVLGAVFAHRLGGDPLWLFLVGPPGDGKTELLRPLGNSEEVFTVSTLSPSALISGFITEGDDPSLLPKLDGKVLVIKDFTAILQMQREARQEIIGTLRDAYDGEAAKAFGTGETRRYRSRFGVIAAVTPVIDEYDSVNAHLGERFLRVRVPKGRNALKIARSLRNTASESTMRDELSRAALGVFANQTDVPTVPDAINDRLAHLANLLATARSEVPRDRAGVVAYVPAPEVGTRVAKQLKKLVLGVGMARGLAVVDDGTYRVAIRVAFDSLPSMRRRLLGALWKLRGEFAETRDIANECECDTDTARIWLADLRLLGIVDRLEAARNAHTWRLRGTFVEDVEAAQAAGELEIRSLPPDSAPHGGDSVQTTVGGNVGGCPAITESNADDGDDSDARELAARQSVEAEAEALSRSQSTVAS